MRNECVRTVYSKLKRMEKKYIGMACCKLKCMVRIYSELKCIVNKCIRMTCCKLKYVGMICYKNICFKNEYRSPWKPCLDHLLISRLRIEM